MFEREVVISTDETGISVNYPDKRVEAIAWARRELRGYRNQ